MSRHRIVRSMNYSDEYDGYEDVYGHSVEDDYSMSPSDAAFMYDRSNRQAAQISAFLTSDDIAEEDESDLGVNDGTSETGRRDSQSSIRQHLSDIDEARLRSCLDEVRNVIGDSYPENVLVDTILRSEFDVTRTLDELLSSPHKTKKEEPTKLGPLRNPVHKEKQDDENIGFSVNDGINVVEKMGSIIHGERNLIVKNITPGLSSLLSVHQTEGDTFDVPSLSEIYKNHRKPYCSVVNNSGDEDDEIAMNSDNESGSGLSSLCSLRLKHFKSDADGDLRFSRGNVKKSVSLLSAANYNEYNGNDDDDKESAPLSSFSDLLSRHRQKHLSVGSDHDLSMDNSLSDRGQSLSDLYLKHKNITKSDDNHPGGVAPVDSTEDNSFEPERSSSLSALAKRYRSISTSVSEDDNVESSCGSTLLQLAQRHKQMAVSLSNECVMSDKTSNSCENLSKSFSGSPAVIGSLRNRFKTLNIDMNQDEDALSVCVPTEKIACDFVALKCEHDGPKRTMKLDLTSALQSPKESVDMESICSGNTKEETFFVDFDIVSSDAKERLPDIKSSPLLTVVDVNCLTLFTNKQSVQMDGKENEYKNCSPFGKIVCKKMCFNNGRLLPHIPNMIRFKSDIKSFHFDTISPDDQILSHLTKKRRIFY